MAAATLTLLLALLVFLGTKEMFGTGAAFIALALLAFDPNLLAHGALVTTDAALSCFMFASIYAFYRYVKAPSVWRMAIVGISAGLALAVKHTGMLVFPILLLLAICEVVRHLITAQDAQLRQRFGKQALRLAASLVAITVIALAVLWSFYGFRYAGAAERIATQSAADRVRAGLKPHETWLVSTLARWHVLPESYLYGLGGCAANRKLLHELRVGKNLCPRSLVLFSNRVSDQINDRLSGPAVVGCCRDCNSTFELLERDSIFGRSASLLSGSGVSGWDEHRRAPHSAGLCIPLGAYRRCSVGPHSDGIVSGPTSRYRAAAVTRIFFVADVSCLSCLRK